MVGTTRSMTEDAREGKGATIEGGCKISAGFWTACLNLAGCFNGIQSIVKQADQTEWSFKQIARAFAFLDLIVGRARWELLTNNN